MANDASIPLQIQAPPPNNPLGVIGALSQLKETQARIALQNAQLNTANANTADIQQQTASRERTNQAYSRVADLMKDPEVAGQVGSGDISAFQRAGIDPKVINEVHQGVQGRIKDALAIDTDTQKKNATYHDVIGKALDGLQATYGKDPDALKANWLPTVNNLIAEGVLKKGTFPEQIAGIEDIQRLAATNNYYQSMNNAALSRKEAQQKIDTSAAAGKKDIAQANEADVSTQIKQLELNLRKGAGPDTIATGVDAIIPAAQFPEQNKRAKDTAALVLKLTGDPAKASAAVEKVAGEIGDLQKARNMIPVEVDRAKAVEAGVGPLRTQQAVNQARSLRAGDNAAVAKVAPSAIAAVQEHAIKLDQAYATAKDASDSLQTIIDAAEHGNKAAGANLPLVGVETLNALNGIKRVNSAEISQYGTAGSLLDKIKGKIGGLVSGQPIPNEVMEDIRSLHSQLGDNAFQKYAGELDALNKRTGSAYKPTYGAPKTSGTALQPIALKDGTFLTPHDQASADRFRKDHPDLIK